jgi:hypothetical protein
MAFVTTGHALLLINRTALSCCFVFSGSKKKFFFFSVTFHKAPLQFLDPDMAFVCLVYVSWMGVASAQLNKLLRLPALASGTSGTSRLVDIPRNTGRVRPAAWVQWEEAPPSVMPREGAGAPKKPPPAAGDAGAAGAARRGQTILHLQLLVQERRRSRL